MKTTGIVRRIDDLGRVVIPKEIRRTMRIREGEPLEIFTDENGGVVFRKYSPIGEAGIFAGEYAEAIYKSSGIAVAVCDMDGIIAVAGASSKGYLSHPMTSAMASLLESRRPYSATADSTPIHPTEGSRETVGYFAPILSEGNPAGGVMMLSADGSAPDETAKKLVSTAAAFLSSQMQV